MDIRSKVLIELEHNFNAEQLKMIDLAVASAMRGYKVEEMETLPATIDERIPDYLHEYLIRCQIRGLSAGTIEGYKRLIIKFLEWYGKSDLSNIKNTDILVFLAWYEKSSSAKKVTVEHKRIILSAFFKYMHSTGKITKNPMFGIDRIKFEKKLIAPVNDEELEMLRMSIRNARDLAMIEFLYSTGCRVSEVVSANISDIDFERRRITVFGKGKKERVVYLNAKAKMAIRVYLAEREDDNDALFVSSRYPHQRLKKNAIEKNIAQIAARSGVKTHVTPHVFRHTMATDMYEIGRDIVPVQQILGHESIDTTMIYAQVAQERIQDAHRRSIR